MAKRHQSMTTRPGIYTTRKDLAQALGSLVASLVVFLGGVWIVAAHTKLVINIAAWGAVGVLGIVLVKALWKTANEPGRSLSERITERSMAIVIGVLIVAVIAVNLGR